VVSAQQAGAPADAVRPADRALLALLGSVLPAHFRARQRAEWTADLLVLARHGGAARWRYLLGAVLTLPTLRAHARHANAGGPEVVLKAAAPAAVMVARVLAITLGWAVLSWLVMLPGEYLVYRIPAHPAAILLPPLAVLYLGAWAAALDFPLVPVAALVAMVLVALERRRPWQHRLQVAILRVAVIGGVAVLLTSIDLFYALMSTGGGPALGLAGLAATGLGTVGAGLSRPTRILLVVLGVAAVAVAVIDNTVGLPMVVWFRD
jgi:hypothetical protein